MTASILYDVTRKAPVAESVEIAANPWSRFLGLMGRKQLDDGSVLVLEPSNGIHTFFMRFAMDAVFLDKEWRVLHVVDAMKPWRVSRIVRHSRRVVELPGGTCTRVGLQVGDQLSLQQLGVATPDLVGATPED